MRPHLIASLTALALCSSPLLTTATAQDSADETELSAAAVAEKESLDTMEKQIAYIAAHNAIAGFKEQGYDIDINAYILGAVRASEGQASVFSKEETTQIIRDFQKDLRIAAEAEQRRATAANLALSNTFLSENAGKEGVETLPSGLQYKVLRAGDGPRPTQADSVKVHYEGRLIGGTIFDSSYDRGEPTTFPVTGVIRGWVEGLQLMPVGSKYEFYIPSDLAYGPEGTGGEIGPNQALIFQVELIEIVQN